MAKTKPTVAEKLSKIAEELDAIGLSDPKGWRKVAASLKRTLKTMPAEPADARDLLELAAQGLAQLSRAPATDMLAAADSLAGAFEVAGRAAGGQVDPGAISGARRRLCAQFDLGREAPATDGLNLDDAAAMMVQLDPSDSDGWSRLEAALRHLAQTEVQAAARRQILESAAEHCAELGRGDATDPRSAISVLGGLFEKAMAADDDTGPAPAAEPVCQLPAVAGDDLTDHMPPNPDPELIGEFITESIDLIQSAEQALLSLENDPGDLDAVGRVFRAFHTVKGTAGFMDLRLIAELGHHAETLLSRVRDGEIRYSGGYADLSLQALDMIKSLVAAVKCALGGSPLVKPQGYDELLVVLKNPEAAGVSDHSPSAPAPRVGDILVAQGKIGRDQVEKAMAEHPGEPVGVALVKSHAASLSDVGQALRAQTQMRGGAAMVDASVRVSTQRLDRLIDMVGELVIAHSMVAQDAVVVDSHNHALSKKVSHTTKIVRELQDISMSMRMVELKATFSKMARLARDVGRKLGKSVNFLTEGEDTEIDRNLVDIVNDPLVHMVRNAVDHGIETPAERLAAGKPEQGTVKIAAYHSAGSVVVEISDDGKGLDREVLIAKARQRGLISSAPDFNERSLSDREVFNLIFEPGFSTAQVVTDVSGRGVGMDVVKKNIELLRGQVEIRSEKGRGSTFRMSLPLTLAIIDGMVIRVGGEIYVIPTVSIVRSVKHSLQDTCTVLGQGEMLKLQGRLIPLYRISRILEIDGVRNERSQAIVVVVEDGERQAGLVVDELVGRQQVVIKSLGETMKNIPGISGGAIMPDGRVGLIFDVGGLLRFVSPERTDKDRDDGPLPQGRLLAA
ncbi:MAG: chemotaxis protein CheA [Desulfobacterales bacterium]